MGGNEQPRQTLIATPDDARKLDPIDTIHGQVPMDSEVPTIDQGFSAMDPRFVRRPHDIPESSDRGRIYDKKELEALMDALRRIGAFELATPPEFLGVRHAPKNYVLPKYPTNTLPEDVQFSL